MERALLLLAFLGFSADALAEKFALGSMEVQACAKGRERATLVLEIEAPDYRRVQHELKACAEHGVASATLPALLKKEPSAEPAFWEEFRVCSRYTEWISAELSIRTDCRK
jgi:hypothetical protein